MRIRKLMNLAWTAVIVGPTTFRAARHAIAHLRALQRTTELARMMAHVKRHRPANLMEIGSYRGGTLYCWARAVSVKARIISIDLPLGAQMDKYGYGAGDPHGLRDLVLPTQDLQVLLGDSQSEYIRERVATALAGQPLDFLFIDGDHSYTGVKGDYEAYSPLVRAGGLIGFHDIRQNPDMPDLEVWKFWNELKGSGARCREFVDPLVGVGMGIGLLEKA